ncbi:MAG: glutamate--tRNA ligase [Minisyncoccia bacterium]
MKTNDTNSRKVVTRFAPSPTGFMHIGGVRTAIFAWLWARKNDGIFILRIEDTDKEREVEGSISHIMESLKWVGIDWDYGPDKPGTFGSCIQSERLETYREFVDILIQKELAYPDPYTIEEVELFRKKAEKDKLPFLFRNHRPENFQSWDCNKPLRFRVPEIKKYKWSDAVRGELSAGEEALDDFILIKSDGFPTYNFAHIIDDYNMGVTHIFRSDEFISSTPKFLSLYNALGISPPIFVTLPPILKDDRTKKLGKRDGAKDILEYRNEGYLPEAMFNFLSLIGWNPGGEKEVFSISEIIHNFSLERIHKSGGAFNEEKLDWMNKEHIKLLSDEDKFSYVKEYLNKKKSNEDIIKKVTPFIIDRIQKWSDIEKIEMEGELNFFFERPEFNMNLIYWKGVPQPEKVKKYLNWIVNTLKSLGSEISSPDVAKNLIFNYASEKGRGEVLWPLRVSLSGREKSPDPFALLYILGKDESIRRIQVVIDMIK